ncbi:sugar ABC transporter permease [Spongiactinospora sp. TRM90649]|uniref:carbohydrate ABC transporter permease n=1 Tax=Spongiactinospora sp. TRM90649 TaxID=3031114 RepID=UPI0023F872CB|nr:sugar ABC transporter permease [Spongiactinospora sp. TRM90649]MDF5754763.1 sugar ABC transporter permease [Spongiactinospora sp. TRM90649]
MRKTNHGRFIAGFLAVPVILYGVFVASPYVQAFYIALTDWRGLSSEIEIIGFANFAELFGDPVFWQALRNNLILLVTLPVITIGLGLFLAFMLNAAGGPRGGEPRGVRGAKFYRVVYFFPYILSIAIIGVLWKNIYNPINGLINGGLRAIGLGEIQPSWLGDESLAFWAVLAVLVWNGVGFYVVLFTAGIKAIPASLLEAAVLDGASRTQVLFRITIPLIWENIRTSAVYLGIAALDAFAIVQIMTAGGPNDSTQVGAFYLYQNAFSYGRFGYASAMGVVLFVVTLVLSALTLRATRKERIEF